MAEPLDPLAAAYLESLAGKAVGTLDAYHRALRHFLAWLQERPGSSTSFDPATFTRTAAQIYFAELEERGLSVSDRARRKAVLTGFARWLIEEQGLLQRNPLRGVALPAQPLLSPRELSGDQRAIRADASSAGRTCGRRSPEWSIPVRRPQGRRFEEGSAV